MNGLRVKMSFCNLSLLGFSANTTALHPPIAAIQILAMRCPSSLDSITGNWQAKESFEKPWRDLLALWSVNSFSLVSRSDEL